MESVLLHRLLFEVLVVYNQSDYYSTAGSGLFYFAFQRIIDILVVVTRMEFAVSVNHVLIGKKNAITCQMSQSLPLTSSSLNSGFMSLI